MGRLDRLGEILMRARAPLLAALLCFLAASAGCRPAPEVLSGGTGEAETVCVSCHASENVPPRWRGIPSEWKASWHYRNGVSCHDCHGGDSQDAVMAMSPEKGFVGKPAYGDVPRFCGKCHAEILERYYESGHGEALRSSGTGPNCVTCHGSHGIRKADLGIINEERCSACHSYDRARIIKRALSETEEKISRLDSALERLKARGIFVKEEEQGLFRTRVDFRALFHATDTALVRERTGEFTERLSGIEGRAEGLFDELRFRKKFAVFLGTVFLLMCLSLYLLSGPSPGGKSRGR
ncbi:MAG: cytochrome c3 family protein [Nitrospirota bacterium]